jgi:hypothetical protein
MVDIRVEPRYFFPLNRKIIMVCEDSMGEKEEELKAAVEKKHYVRASNLAASLGAPQEQVESLRKAALWQISAAFRNATGTRILAEAQGLSKKEVEEYLRKRSEEERSLGNVKILEPTFDYHTSRYLTFEAWLDYLVRKWDKLSLGT